MRIALLALTLVFFSKTSWSVETFSGFIVQSGTQRILKVSGQSFILTAESSDVKSQLIKLRSNDFISGIGAPIGSNIVRMETIDFVGLSGFLGLWMSPMGLIQVQDFSSISLYLGNQTHGPSVASSLMNYSIIPGSGASWGLFLSDDNQIYYSNLTVSHSKASIQFFDPQTGAFQKEIALSKISR